MKYLNNLIWKYILCLASYQVRKEGKSDQLMEKYNFDSPIEVTLVIEEEDSPEPVLSTGPIVSNNRNFVNTSICPNSADLYKSTNSNNNKVTEEVSNNSISVFKTVIPEGHQEKPQDIQWQLLDVVADNLIHITKCFYHNFVTSNRQMENYERLILEYLNFKHYFFNLSYSTTITILLPQENDSIFLDKFIYRIIKIANRCSWFQITYEMLNKLVQEMMIWTKKKKTNLNIKFGSHNHEQGDMDCTSSALTISNRLNQSKQKINISSNNGLITNHKMQGANTQSDIVSITHLPVQTINISPNIRHITNYSTNESNSPLNTRTNCPMQDANNPTIKSHIKNDAKSKITEIIQNNRSEIFHSKPEKYISQFFLPKINESNQGTSGSYNIDPGVNNSMQGISRLPNNGTNIDDSTETITLYNNFSCQAININTSKVILSSGPPNQEITISVDSGILTNINKQNTIQLNNKAIERHVNEASGVNVTKRQTNDNSYYPNRNSNSLPHRSDGDFHHNKDNSSAINLKSPVDDLFYDDSRKAGYELFNTDTLRSSISRDSGCDSPIYGSICNGQTIETSTNKEQETPIISHVTSMNPNAVHLSSGFCKVCGATTNNMCIGCYQKYYCSFLCQMTDWENHKYICTE